MTHRPLVFAITVALLASRASAMTIVLNPNATLAANAPALAAFQRAANQWSSRLSDPITVTIDAGLDATLGAQTIGSTESVVLEGGFDEIRNPLVTDSLLDPDDGVNAFLPTAATFGAKLPTGRTLNGDLLATKANLKAIGFTGLDEEFGVSDASISFNPTFDFDYDNRDGSDYGTIDFETAAAHEIGHALGFVSFVDSINDGASVVAPTTLDLFRFHNGDPQSDPSSLADFATKLRDLTPGDDDVFDDTTDEFRFATGIATLEFPDGDGNQASHWKGDELTGQLIGLMDPTLAPANFFGLPFIETPSYADLRAMDLIGYDFITPEPTAIAALIAGSFVSRRRRRVQRRRHADGRSMSS